MKLRVFSPLCVAAALVASSCTPYVEPQPPVAPADPSQRQLTPAEQQKVKEEQDKAKEIAQKQLEEEKKQVENSQPKPKTDEGTTASGGGEATKPKEQPKTDPATIPVARPVPGKPGMVFSPFNNKQIDVKGIPSGKLVADPTYPASEKKHFRVP